MTVYYGPRCEEKTGRLEYVVGLSVGVVGKDLSPDLKLSLTFAMWLGRLEFIAVLVLFAPGTWFKKG